MPVQVLRPLVLILGSLAPPACKARVLAALSDMLVRWIRRAPLRRGGGTFFDENSEEDGDGEGGNVGGAGQEEAERVLLALDRMGVFALDSSEGHALVEMAVLDLYHKVLDAASAADAAESEAHGGGIGAGGAGVSGGGAGANDKQMIILPSVGLTYRLLLSGNGLTVSRTCGVLAACRSRLAAAKAGAPGDRRVEAAIEGYNKFLVDACNGLWRNRALPVTSSEAAMSFMPAVYAPDTRSGMLPANGAAAGGSGAEGVQSVLSITSSQALAVHAAEFARSQAKAASGGRGGSRSGAGRLVGPEAFKGKHKVA